MAANKAGPGAIGLRLLNFSRVHIQHYVPAPNFTSRAELPRSWQEATEEPLVWKVTEPAAMPAVEEPLFEEAPQPEPKQDGFPTDLVKIMEAHQARQVVEQTAPQSDAPAAQSTRPQIVRKPAPQAPAELPRPKLVQRQPDSVPPPQAPPRPVQRPAEKGKPGLLEEVTPAVQLPTVENDTPLAEVDSWESEHVLSEDTPVVPLDVQLDEPSPIVDEAPADDDGWLPTHDIPMAQQPPAVQPPVVQPSPKPAPVQPAKPDARPVIQRMADRPSSPPVPQTAKAQPPAAVQPPIVSALVGDQSPDSEPASESAVPTNFSLPLLDDEDFDKETERVEYVSPDDDSSILLNTTEARASRLDSIHRSLEAVQRNLDSIQRFVGSPEDDNSPAVGDSAEEVVSFSEQPEPDEESGFWHTPEQPATSTPPTPTVQRSEYQPPAPLPSRPSQKSPSPQQDTPEPSTTDETPDLPSMIAPYDLPLTEPELPEESSDLVIALQSAETAMPVASEMRDFEPSVWTTPAAPQNGIHHELISRTPETTASSPPSNGTPIRPVERGDSPAYSNPVVDTSTPEVGFSDSDDAADALNGATPDLLKLLDLPPDTPVIGMRSPTSIVRRSTNGEQEYIEAEDEPPANSVQEVPLDVALMGSTGQPIMRDPQAAPANGSNNTNNGSYHDTNGRSVDVGETDENVGDQGPNIDKLARDVHRILRERLRIEQERRSDR